MRVERDESWQRRGLTLLWHPDALGAIADAGQVVSLHRLFSLARVWPDDLPSSEGDALVVAGLEACLDAVAPDDGEAWLAERVKPVLHRFQDRYQGGAALVFWLPSGRQRIDMDRVSGEYRWRCHGSSTLLPIGRALFGGAGHELGRIVLAGDPDGDGWAGLTLRRSS